MNEKASQMWVANEKMQENISHKVVLPGLQLLEKLIYEGPETRSHTIKVKP